MLVPQSHDSGFIAVLEALDDSVKPFQRHLGPSCNVTSGIQIAISNIMAHRKSVFILLTVYFIFSCQSVFGAACTQILLDSNDTIQLTTADRRLLQQIRQEELGFKHLGVLPGNTLVRYKAHDILSIDGNQFTIKMLIGYGKEGAVYVADNVDSQSVIIKDFVDRKKLEDNVRLLNGLRKNGFSVPQFTVSKAQHFIQFEFILGISIYDLSYSYGKLPLPLANNIKEKVEKLMVNPTGVQGAAILEPNIILDISSGRLFIVDPH